MATLVKCKCQHCNQNIEFDSDGAGQMIACPNCGMETRLFIATSPPQFAPVTKIDKPTPAKIEKKDSAILLQIMSGLLLVISLGLIFNGCSGELTESASANGSAIRQTVCAIQYGSGFIVFGLCLITSGIVRLIKK